MIRPSALSLAEKCPMSAVLAAEYPEGSERTEEGTRLDAEISTAIEAGTEPVSPAAREALAWLRRTFPDAIAFIVQELVELREIETDRLITRGTPDLVVILPGRRLVIVDWKTKGQFWTGRVAPPHENLQGLTYAVAAGIKHAAASVRFVLAFYDDTGVTSQEGPELPATEWWPIIARIQRIQDRRPEAIAGEHCHDCYPRKHCARWLLPAYEGPANALAPLTQGALTHDNAAQALAVYEHFRKAAEEALEVAEGMLQAFARANGPIATADGREWGYFEKPGRRQPPSPEELEAAGAGHLVRKAPPTIAELEKAGLAHLCKPGKPTPAYMYRKAAK